MKQISVFLKYTLLALSAYYLFVYFYMVYYRIQYPFELDWIEGGLLGQVQRIADGQAVYTAPSLKFAAFIYPPLYFYLSALVSKFFGESFFSLRFVSFISSLMSLACIYLIVHKETANKFIGFISTGFFAATFRITGAWMDIGRVDSLFVTLLLVFTYFVRQIDSRRSMLLAGIFAALAFLTKQTASIVCIPVIGYLFLRDWKKSLIVIFTALTIAGGATLALNLASNGWYTFYVFELLRYQTEWLPRDEFIKFWYRDLLAHGTIALGLSVFYFYKMRQSYKVQLLGILSISTLAGTYISRMKLGGYDNVLLPLYAIIAVTMGLGINQILGIKQVKIGEKSSAIFYMFLILQMGILFYDPVRQIPSPADLKAGREFVQYLSALDGQVYIPDHPYLLALAGKPLHAHNSAIWDILRGKESNRGKAILEPQLSEAIKNQYFSVIITDTQWDILPRLQRYYAIKDYVFAANEYFYPITGVRIRPTYIYLPKKLPDK